MILCEKCNWVGGEDETIEFPRNKGVFRCPECGSANVVECAERMVLDVRVPPEE